MDVVVFVIDFEARAHMRVQERVIIVDLGGDTTDWLNISCHITLSSSSPSNHNDIPQYGARITYQSLLATFRPDFVWIQSQQTKHQSNPLCLPWTDIDRFGQVKSSVMALSRAGPCRMS